MTSFCCFYVNFEHILLHFLVFLLLTLNNLSWKPCNVGQILKINAISWKYNLEFKINEPLLKRLLSFFPSILLSR